MLQGELSENLLQNLFHKLVPQLWFQKYYLSRLIWALLCVQMQWPGRLQWCLRWNGMWKCRCTWFLPQRGSTAANGQQNFIWHIVQHWSHRSSGSEWGAIHHGAEVHNDIQVEGLQNQVQEFEAGAIPQYSADWRSNRALVPKSGLL